MFPAHMTFLYEALDLVLFGSLKTIKKTTHGDFGDDSVQDQITKLLQASEQILTSFTIRVAFKKAGLIAYVSSKPVRLVFNEEILRENLGFSEIWNFNIPVHELSKRRRSHQFGFLNVDFLARRPDE
jgi:tRNA(Ser,Leu) C12 N-acetylase TAN1